MSEDKAFVLSIYPKVIAFDIGYLFPSCPKHHVICDHEGIQAYSNYCETEEEAWESARRWLEVAVIERLSE
jgi:hypothetical protein